MKLSKKGDLYFPGSSDFMELAKKEDLVFPESEKIVVYLVSAINVQKGNPKGIHSLRDLTKDRNPSGYRKPRDGLCGDLCCGNH